MLASIDPFIPDLIPDLHLIRHTFLTNTTRCAHPSTPTATDLASPSLFFRRALAVLPNSTDRTPKLALQSHLTHAIFMTRRVQRARGHASILQRHASMSIRAKDQT